MERSRKAGLGLVALVALALVAAYAVGVTTQGWVFASPSAQTPPSSQSTAPSSQPKQSAGNTQKQEAADREQRLLNSFMTTFTSRLGVDETKLNSAFLDSVNSTVDQAVKDGTITQAQ